MHNFWLPQVRVARLQTAYTLQSKTIIIVIVVIIMFIIYVIVISDVVTRHRYRNQRYGVK